MTLRFRSLIRFAPLALAAGLALTAPTLASADKASDQAAEKAIRASLQQHMPSLPVDSVTPTPVKGLYQIISKGQIAYVTEDGQFLLAGSLIDLKNQQNLTARVRDQERLKLLAKVPADRKLVFPAKGERKHTITILTDPTCPYCEKLHSEVPALQAAGIQVNYILTPRSGPGTPGFVESSQIMCSDKPMPILESAFARKKISGDACKNKEIEANIDLASALGLSGTPFIVMPDGSAIPGYRPAKLLIQALNTP
jgi:thiol:disulfide interchange protein DsbC